MQIRAFSYILSTKNFGPNFITVDFSKQSCFKVNVIITNYNKKLTPAEGLGPSTLGLIVPRSTD